MMMQIMNRMTTIIDSVIAMQEAVLIICVKEDREDKRNKEIFKHLFVGTFGLCGLNSVEPFIVYGAKRHSEMDKNTNFENYKKRLTEIVEK